MKYTIAKLASAAGVSVRTLHYYDEIDLLRPAEYGEDNGYRYYGEEELLTLQQIMFFSELDFPLAKIKEIISSPNFSNIEALESHRQVLLSQQTRLTKLIKTIDLTINSLKKGETMTANDLYGGFTKQQMAEYQKEAGERWGNTEAYKESVRNVKKMGKDGLKKVIAEGKKIEIELGRHVGESVGSEIVQKLIARHRAQIGNFYQVSDEIYRGLAEMYLSDTRFYAHYEEVTPGLAQFLHDAIIASLE